MRGLATAGVLIGLCELHGRSAAVTSPDLTRRLLANVCGDAVRDQVSAAGEIHAVDVCGPSLVIQLAGSAIYIYA